MKIFGKRDPLLSFDMFDLHRSAEEAKTYNKCENIYHKGQSLAWNGKEVLDMLVEKHGKPTMDPQTRAALQRIFAIILWGELAAWRISAQLADRLVPLEAKMAATSQVHDEARHFYVMYDYLSMLGDVPKTLDYAPRKLLQMILRTDNLAYKLLGMQLMVETLALTIFQAVRLAAPEPVLTELMTYYEKDEARHVGLGMQYLPVLLKDMSKVQMAGFFAFQARILALGMWETKVIEDDLNTVGIDPREVMERGRAKQMVVLHKTFETLGLNPEKGIVMGAFSSAAELLFPSEELKGNRMAQLGAAYRAIRGELPEVLEDEMAVHDSHEIMTALDSRARKDKRAN
jgi:hypothetical protein